MSLTLTDMRELLRKGAGGLDSNELPDDEADRYLNMALWEIGNRFEFTEKECIITAQTVVGQRKYGLPNDLDALQSVSVDEDERSFKLERMSEDELDEVRDTDTDARARPEKYVRIHDSLFLEPIPDDVYTLRTFMWRTVASLEAGVVDTVDLPRNWHELVVEGAIVRYHFYNGDYNLARQAENFPIRKERAAVETQSKEERDSRYAGLEVQRDAPDGRQ